MVWLGGSRCAERFECGVNLLLNRLFGVIKDARRGYGRSEDAIHLDRCVGLTLRFKAKPEIGAQICGVCVRVCSFGNQRHPHPVRS